MLEKTVYEIRRRDANGGGRDARAPHEWELLNGLTNITLFRIGNSAERV
ncbi:MAG TPA: hypothetical protein VGO67_02530 [Verrucomicrobiae bacterium]